MRCCFLIQVLVDPNIDKIQVDGRPLQLSSLKEQLVYFAVNKPKVGEKAFRLGPEPCIPSRHITAVVTLHFAPQGYICSNNEGPESGKQGRRVVDLLSPWLKAWAKKGGSEVRWRFCWPALARQHGAHLRPSMHSVYALYTYTPGHPQGRLPPRLFTVGRLDVASTGLIFVTNDGGTSPMASAACTFFGNAQSCTLIGRPAFPAVLRAMGTESHPPCR